MFPFIWWLGSPAPDPGDGVQHESGEDFLRRRVLMATSASARRSGTPASAVAWYYAAAQYVDIDGSGLVQSWRDRGPNGYALTAAIEAERPSWEASGGWSANKSSVMFPGSKNIGTGALAAMMSGVDVPYWVVATAQITDLSTDRVITSWDDVTSTQSENFVAQTSGFMSMTRTDDSTATATATAATGGVGTGHRRLGWSFSGSAVTAWVDLEQVLSGAACNVGDCTFTRLRVGDGIGGTADSLVGRIAELIIGIGQLSQAEWGSYYHYSIGEWG